MTRQLLATHPHRRRSQRFLLPLLALLSLSVALTASGRNWHHDGDHDSDDNGVVAVGHDAVLAAGQQADAVVAILGSASSAGEVGDSVVAVLGSTHVTGPVGQTVVAVLGSSYVNSPVGGDVVAVLGDVELGPNAVVSGQVVVVGGTLTRDPGAVVGGEQNVVIGGGGHFDHLKNPWVRHCLLLGRPLAFDASVGWAWGVAFAILALYLLVSLLLHRSIDRGARTFEQHPGPSLFAALLALIGIPILIVILVVTVIGVIAVPFVLVGIVLLEVFGKIVMLAWIGRRLIRAPEVSTPAHAAKTVLIGGLIVLVLYVIPGFGFLAYKLLDLIGLGVLVYMLLLQSRSQRPAAGTPQAAAAGAPASAIAALAAAEPAAQPGSTPPPPPPPSPDPAAGSRRVSPADAVTLPRAGFWIRMAALLLDCILVGVVLHLLRASSNVFLIVLAAYGAIMWKSRGSTVGGLVCSLQVVRSDGLPMDWSTALVRALGSFVSLIVVGLGFIWIAADSEKRGWHDKIAGTLVVKVP